MEPLKMEANREILPDYKADMCPETLDLLRKRQDAFSFFYVIELYKDMLSEFRGRIAVRFFECS